MNPQIYLDFALETIQKSRNFIKNKRDFTVSLKADNLVVTEVDRETEFLIRDEIRKKFPDHGIVGEEFGIENEESDFKWFIDPIDGTISFSNGIPLYGTILGLHYQGKPLVGIIDHPDLDLCYFASKGGGTFCNDKKIVIVQDKESIDDEIIATGDRAQFEKSNTMEQYQKLLSTHSLTRTIPDCFGNTLAVKGAVGAMIDFHTNPWDMSATQILVEEAGGKYLEKKYTKPDGKVKYDVICGKPKVVDWLSGIFV